LKKTARKKSSKTKAGGEFRQSHHVKNTPDSRKKKRNGASKASPGKLGKETGKAED